MKISFLAVALICIAAVAAGSVQAQPADVIVLTPHNLALGAPNPQCLAVNTFDVFDVDGLDGMRLGIGIACIKKEVTECGEPPLIPPFTPGCRQRVRLMLTIKFCPETDLLCESSTDSLTIRTVFREIFSGAFSLVNIAQGRVLVGTGAYKGQRGTLEGAGSTIFSAQGIDTTIVWVVRLTNHDEPEEDDL